MVLQLQLQVRLSQEVVEAVVQEMTMFQVVVELEVQVVVVKVEVDQLMELMEQPILVVEEVEQEINLRVLEVVALV